MNSSNPASIKGFLNGKFNNSEFATPTMLNLKALTVPIYYTNPDILPKIHNKTFHLITDHPILKKSFYKTLESFLSELERNAIPNT